jgi:hypothetical protein
MTAVRAYTAVSWLALETLRNVKFEYRCALCTAEVPFPPLQCCRCHCRSSLITLITPAAIVTSLQGLPDTLTAMQRDEPPCRHACMGCLRAFFILYECVFVLSISAILVSVVSGVPCADSVDTGVNISRTWVNLAVAFLLLIPA